MAYGDMKGFAEAQAKYENMEDPSYSQEDAEMEECEDCEGVGSVDEEECDTCEGSGEVEKEEEEEDFDIPDEPDIDEDVCFGGVDW
jgi:RecJ-like exonuclease